MEILEVTTPSGLKLRLQRAGYDRDGNQLWRECNSSLSDDDIAGILGPEWAGT